jgi:hypothetical protein
MSTGKLCLPELVKLAVGGVLTEPTNEKALRTFTRLNAATRVGRAREAAGIRPPNIDHRAWFARTSKSEQPGG